MYDPSIGGAEGSAFLLVKTRLHHGLWEGLLIAHSPDPEEGPEIAVMLRDTALSGVTVTRTDRSDRWVLRIPIPVEAVSDGVHSFVITDLASDAVLGSFTLIAGDVVTDDLRAEVALLRAELDLLKRAFRRHCLEG